MVGRRLIDDLNDVKAEVASGRPGEGSKAARDLQAQIGLAVQRGRDVSAMCQRYYQLTGHYLSPEPNNNRDRGR